jgi:penicillin amidase
VEESIDALSTFKAPGQNYAVIDSTGDIAMIVAGKLPVRWSGQGFTLSDGASAAYEWDQWIPYEHMPLEVNPERGYVASANQWVVDEAYPYDIGNRFAAFERGARLDDVLGEASGWTLQDMMELQLDNANYLAEVTMPTVLDMLEAQRSQLSDLEGEALDAWLEWSYQNDAEEMGPSLWSRFWPAFRGAVWDDEYDVVDAPMLKPTRDLTAELLVDQPGSSFFDDVATDDRVESSRDQVLRAFQEAVATLEEEALEAAMPAIAPDDPKTWLWAHFGDVHVPHLAQIDALGRFNLGSSGGDESVNAVDEDNGPSWRMVVELSPEGPTAYGVFPGGPSGNPGSALYDSDVDRWAEGGYHKLELLQGPPAAERVAEG